MRLIINIISIFTTCLMLSQSVCLAMEKESCAICFDQSEIKVQLIPCGHEFCPPCMKKHHKSLLKENLERTYNFLEPNCPLCRAPFLEVKAVGNSECEEIDPFVFGLYKAETREEKIHALVGLKMPELIKAYEENLLKDGLATKENITQEVEDAIESLYTGFVEKINHLSDEVLIELIKNSLVIHTQADG